MQKNQVDLAGSKEFELFSKNNTFEAKTFQNRANMAQNTRFLRFCAYGCILQEIYDSHYWSPRQCGYFPNFGIFVRPLDQIRQIWSPPFIFLSMFKTQNNPLWRIEITFPGPFLSPRHTVVISNFSNTVEISKVLQKNIWAKIKFLRFSFNISNH